MQEHAGVGLAPAMLVRSKGRISGGMERARTDEIERQSDIAKFVHNSGLDSMKCRPIEQTLPNATLIGHKPDEETKFPRLSNPIHRGGDHLDFFWIGYVMLVEYHHAVAIEEEAWPWHIAPQRVKLGPAKIFEKSHSYSKKMNSWSPE
jgi:hypothetical protein